MRFQHRRREPVLAWAQQAAAPDLAAAGHRRIARALDDHRTRKTQDIQALERERAGRLARTPSIVLLSLVRSPIRQTVSGAPFTPA